MEVTQSTSTERLAGLSSEDFYEIKRIDEVSISPDGSLLAYVLQEVTRSNNDYNRSIWLVPCAGGTPRKFTAGVKQDFSPRWSPDGKRLAFVSTRGGKPQVYIIELDGGEAWQLTSITQGVAVYAWSPDGTQITFLSRTNAEERAAELEDKPKTPLSKLEAKLEEEKKKDIEQRKIDPRFITRLIFRSGTEYRDDRRSHVYVQDVKLGAQPKRLTDGDYDFGPPVFMPDGQAVLTHANRYGQEDVVVRSNLLKLPIIGGDPIVLTDGLDGDHNPKPLPDGSGILYQSFHATRLHEQRLSLRLLRFDEQATQDLTDDLDLDVQNFCLAHDHRTVLFLAAYKGENRVYAYDLQTGTHRPIITGKRSVMTFDAAQNAPRLALVISDPFMPTDVFCASLDTGTETRLTDINKEFLAQRQLSDHEELWFTGSDGLPIQGWYLKPQGYEAGKRYPLLVQIHGGPHIMWGFDFWHEFQVFAAQGYIVFYCNPRGSEGYGFQFKGAIKNKWAQDDREDILRGSEEMVKLGLADPDRMVVTGGSFGGYMTAMIVGYDHRFKAAVAQRGVYNFLSLYGNSDAMTLIEWEFDSFPWTDSQKLWKLSPIAYVENVQTPLMIIHSEQDYRAGIVTADDLFVALRRLDKKAVLVRYPREGHELSRSGEPEHRVDRINRMVAWFNEHVTNRTGIVRDDFSFDEWREGVLAKRANQK